MKVSLVVQPTQDTIERLRSIFMSAPFSLAFDKMFIEICTAEVPEGQALPWTERHGDVYTDVKVLSLEPHHRYLDNVPTRILMASTKSQQLSDRASELGGDFKHFPWVLTTDLQASSTVRSFLASVATTMVVHEGPFSFTGEITLVN